MFRAAKQYFNRITSYNRHCTTIQLVLRVTGLRICRSDSLVNTGDILCRFCALKWDRIVTYVLLCETFDKSLVSNVNGINYPGSECHHCNALRRIKPYPICFINVRGANSKSIARNILIIRDIASSPSPPPSAIKVLRRRGSAGRQVGCV